MVIFRLLIAATAMCLLGVSAFAQVATYPYSETFDGVMVPALPAGWSSSEARLPGTADFATTSSSARSLPNAVLSTNATVPQRLMSLAFDFRAVVPETLRFAVRRSTSHLAGLIVEASLDGGSTFPFLLSDTLWNGGTTSYQVVTCALPPSLTISPSVRFQWRTLPAVSGSTGTLRIDDIEVTARAACDLAVRSVTLLPARPREGDLLTAAITVVNCGTLPVEGSTLAPAWIVDNDTVPLVSQNIRRLNAGDSLPVSVPLGTPAAGRLTLTASVTAEGDGNASNNVLTVSFSVALRPGTIVLNEIMYAPLTPQPEWLELYNTREAAVPLNRWNVADGSGAQHTISSPGMVPPNGYVLLTADSMMLFSTLHPSAAVIQVAGFPSLNNGGDEVILSDADGILIDSVRYDPAWNPVAGCSLERIDPGAPTTEAANWAASLDSSGATPGRQNSVARLPHDLALSVLVPHVAALSEPMSVQCTVVNAGSEACDGCLLRLERLPVADRGDTVVLLDTLRYPFGLSPGGEVSVTLFWKTPLPGLSSLRAVVESAQDGRPANDARCCTVAVPFAARSLVINEIMAAPLPGEAEYCELMNAGIIDVDITGWSLADRPTADGRVNRWPIGDTGAVVHGGEYFILASDSSLFGRFSMQADAEHQHIRIVHASSLGLNNDGDDVVLRDAAGTTIDSVAYAPSWHSPALIDPMGHALERIAPQMPSSDRRSWSSSVAPSGGTPGRQNSIYTRSLPSTSRLSCMPNPFSPDGDGKDDMVIIHYELPVQESLLSISLYDITGHRIRRLVNAEPGGPSGDVPWDGRTDNAVRARIGIYIVFLEAVDQASGKTLSAKTTLVLAGRL